MINIAALEKKYIGRWVEYRGQAGEHERGRIKGWNEQFIFVVYKCNGEWHRFEDFTGQATSPSDLHFLEEPIR